MTSLVTMAVNNGIATLTIRRPEVLNAINQEMWGALVSTVQDLALTDGIRVAIITGEGRAFCVGADLKETAWRGETQAQTRRRVEANQQDLAREMIRVPIPIIAAVNGYALGGGLEIAMAADIRIASEMATFGFPETTIGRFISGGASLLLPNLVGLSQAKQLIYTGEHIKADEALRLGLVNQVVPEADLLGEANAVAHKIAANAPASVSLAKRVMNRVALADLENALVLETEALIATYSTDDNETGVAAFAQNGTAVFSGE